MLTRNINNAQVCLCLLHSLIISATPLREPDRSKAAIQDAEQTQRMLTKDSDSMALEAILWQDLFLHPESQLLSKHFRRGRQDCVLATENSRFPSPGSGWFQHVATQHIVIINENLKI